VKIYSVVTGEHDKMNKSKGRDEKEIIARQRIRPYPSWIDLWLDEDNPISDEKENKELLRWKRVSKY
jgi:hypothetical protein